MESRAKERCLESNRDSHLLPSAMVLAPEVSTVAVASFFAPVVVVAAAGVEVEPREKARETRHHWNQPHNDAVQPREKMPGRCCSSSWWCVQCWAGGMVFLLDYSSGLLGSVLEQARVHLPTTVQLAGAQCTVF